MRWVCELSLRLRLPRSALEAAHARTLSPPQPNPPAPQAAAPAQPNLPYLSREAPTLRTANTSSAVLIKCAGRGGRQLGLSPGHVHFGTLRAGEDAARAVRLVNLGPDIARVSISQPAAPLK